MVTLDWRVESRTGFSLVALVVENPTGAARRVRVKNCLDAPVWPPRREGVPEVGWDDGGFEGVVAPGESCALGYASPARPVEPPVELAWTERAGETERVGRSERAGKTGRARATSRDGSGCADDDRWVEATPEGVVRTLGDPRPPADAVPDPARTGRTDAWRSP